MKKAKIDQIILEQARKLCDDARAAYPGKDWPQEKYIIVLLDPINKMIAAFETKDKENPIEF